MQIQIRNGQTKTKLTKTEQRQLRQAADILKGIGHVEREAGDLSMMVRAYAKEELISQDKEESDARSFKEEKSSHTDR